MMTTIYKSYCVSSTAERDPANNLFRARIIFEIRHNPEESNSSFKLMWAPAEGRFQSEEEAERYGVEWAKKWIDDNTKP
jgi:hypothetical protein